MRGKPFYWLVRGKPVKQLFRNEPGVLWMNGDDPETRLLLEEVTTQRWKRMLGGNRIVVIDEAQRIANIGIKLKLITDQISCII